MLQIPLLKKFRPRNLLGRRKEKMKDREIPFQIELDNNLYLAYQIRISTIDMRTISYNITQDIWVHRSTNMQGH